MQSQRWLPRLAPLFFGLLSACVGTVTGPSDQQPEDASVADAGDPLPEPECATDAACTVAPRLQCIAGHCVEPAGNVQCRTDAHCADMPETPVCWMGICIAPPVKHAPPVSLIPNAWTLAKQETTGGRRGPLLAFVPHTGRFVVSAGEPSATSADQLHYSTETLDLSLDAYENAYPPNAPATYMNASGPTKAPPHPAWGYTDFSMTDALGVVRMPFFSSAYGVGSKAYFQYAYVPDRKSLYAFLHNRTVTYDPVLHVWADLGVTPTPTDNPQSVLGPRDMMWGSMGYDPIHHELVLVGGSAPVPGGSPGTWTFSLDSKTWQRLSLGSAPINALRAKVKEAREKAQALVSQVRNRLFRVETTSEAQRDLATPATALTQAVGALADGFQVDQLPTEERPQGQRAAGHLQAAKQAAAALVAGTRADAGGIVDVQSIDDALLRAELALEVEPPARAQSQLAYHRGTASLFLFGGDGQDRAYADTWRYDCSTRRWQPVFPALSPSPRAGHALVTLPKSDKLLLVGGFVVGNGHSYMYGDTYRALGAELWVYDPAQNTWSKLLTAGTPPGNLGLAEAWTASANEEDVVTVLSPALARQTFVMSVDATKVDAAGTTSGGVPPETLVFREDEDTPTAGARSYNPAFYDRQPMPSGHALDDLAASMPVNKWVAVKPPKGVDIAGWGSTTFDTSRRQVLYWGGGHSEYKGTDVKHFSLASGSWSGSVRPDHVLEWTPGFLCPTTVSFHNRPMIPVHGYQAYGYDPPSGQMLALNGAGVWRYDVVRREWLFPPIVPPFRIDVMHVSFETTPQGLVVWGDVQGAGKLFRYNGSSFDPLPMSGAALAPPWCDGSSFAWDVKRNALWLAPGNTLFRYDLASGVVTPITTTIPSVLGGQYPVGREQVYVPQADLIFLMARYGPTGSKFNVAYDPTKNKWYSVALQFDDGNNEQNFSWSSALLYDAPSGLILLHSPVSFWALKLDRTSATLVELTQ